MKNNTLWLWGIIVCLVIVIMAGVVFVDINKDQINKEQINKEQINKEQINKEQINKEQPDYEFIQEQENPKEVSSMRSGFMEECNILEGMEEYCACTYDYIIEHYGEEKFIDMAIKLYRTEEMPPEINEASDACMDKLLK